jgi:hypothetical protein
VNPSFDSAAQSVIEQAAMKVWANKTEW